MDDQVNVTFNLIEKDGVYMPTDQHFNELFNLYKIFLNSQPMSMIFNDEVNKMESYGEILKVHLRYGVCIEARIGDKLAGFITIQSYDNIQAIQKEEFRIMSPSMDAVKASLLKTLSDEYDRLYRAAIPDERRHSKIVVIRDAYVDEAFRRHGIAEELFLKALEISWEKGYEQVIGRTNVYSVQKGLEKFGVEVLSSCRLGDLPGWENIDSSIKSRFAREGRLYGIFNPNLVKAKL